jgi:prepilin-type N-terminal cleavage/methylation domain-containing protein
MMSGPGNRMPLLARVRRREHAGDQGGFTMVEVVMSIFIFGIVITGVIAGMSSALNLTRQDRNRSIAANLASQEMDTVRSTDFTDLPLGELITTQTVDGVPYTVTRDTEWLTASATQGPCQATSTSSNAFAYLGVDVLVTWNNMTGIPPVASHTVVSPPVGTYSNNTGAVAVTVKDSTGAPNDGVTVELDDSTGAQVDSQQTFTDGCAFFAYEPPGSYTVKLTAPSGYVNDQEVACCNGTVWPSLPATVSAGSIVPLQFQFDQDAALSLTMAPSGGSLPTSPAQVPITIGNSHITPSGTKTFTGTGATGLTQLFPYTDGYTTWAGTCSDADPQGTKPAGNPFYVGATRGTPLSVTPGGTTAGTVTLPSAILTTQTSVGVARSATLTATHVVPTGSSGGVDAKCTTGEVYTLGVTSASTGALTAALPYGSWTITASGSVKSMVLSLSPIAAAACTPSPCTLKG